MLERTFVHVRGVGAASEAKLWAGGAVDWPAFVDLLHRGLLSRRYRRALPTIEQSSQALRAADTSFFHERLPSSDRWRMYADFADRAAYLDIETTGLSPSFDEVTVVGLYDGHRFQTFIRGKNLDDFPRVAAQIPLLVTFNGAQFDVPFLRAAFPSFAPRAHVDLRYPLGRLGHSGGLKSIEQAVGIKRPSDIRDVDGFEAVLLWRRYQRGDRGALDRLVEYARHDVMNLVPLAELALKGMTGRLGFADHVLDGGGAARALHRLPSRPQLEGPRLSDGDAERSWRPGAAAGRTRARSSEG